jgi:hypothetical protein
MHAWLKYQRLLLRMSVGHKRNHKGSRLDFLYHKHVANVRTCVPIRQQLSIQRSSAGLLLVYYWLEVPVKWLAALVSHNNNNNKLAGTI